MIIRDSITGEDHLEIRIDGNYVHIEQVGTDQIITDDLIKLMANHKQVTLKDLFQYFGFITSLSRKDADAIARWIREEF